MRRVLIAIFAIITLLVANLFLPVLFDTDVLSPICELGVANAQDNPCLAQEATLAVLGLQATIDAGNYQATIAALESSSNGVNYQATIVALNNELATAQAGGSVATSLPSVGIPFGENFTSNERGWDLTPRNEGVSRISQGRLLMTANPNQVYWQPIPGLQVGDDFYIEATVNIVDRNDTFVGFGLGDPNTGQIHMFLSGYDYWANNDARQDGWYVLFFDQLEEVFSTQYNDLLDVNAPVSIGLESSGGLYTLYVNGSATETAQIVPYGNEIGLLVYYPDRRSSGRSAYFDDISVREVR